MPIHPTAIVDKSAEVDPSADIGAYAIVETGVRIGAGTKIYPHAYVSQGTTLGQRCQIHPFAVVGHHPQDLAWEGTPSYTEIGDETIIREGASVHRGTVPESTTVVGKNVYMMATSHVGHNCVIADQAILVNGVLLSGHVHVGRRAILAGGTAVHQFVRIGELVMISGGRVPNDVPPFMLVGPAGVVDTNVVGLRRAGLSSEERLEIRQAYKTLYRSKLMFREAIERVAEMVRSEPGRRLVEFLRGPSRRGYLGFKKRGRDSGDAEQLQ
ncbi:MAG: acyl-ACP--UDP-N-acetylglucosamine O-acyltransferase [Planctomycetes bacterium]|nr:acyl-ACP--UDP-N-acetylglucosamine O-acyltransferase [Planctomycetota bacterium]